MGIKMNDDARIPQYVPDSILTLAEISRALRLDQRTVSRIASVLGGKRIGRCLRFRWGTVMEAFSDANFEERSRECLVGQSHHQRSNGGHQVFPSGSQKRPRVDGGEKLGGKQKKGTSGSGGGQKEDAYGLRAALGLGS